MTSLADIAPRSIMDRRFRACASIVAAVTVVRLVGLVLSDVDLFFDESQYWAWSRELAFGYFSKPPLLAWLIAGAELVCGSSEACIRAPAPILYFGTSMVTYLIAEALYGERTAFWAALCLALSGGVAFSSRIISTDVPLLFFWALALLSYVKLMQGGTSKWGVLLGLSFGLGMLAKYAMVYFVLGVAAAAAIDRDARTLLWSSRLWLAAAIGLALLAPNAIWNAQNGFVTLHHVGQNIEGDGAAFSFMRGFEFLASQFAVFGPIVFGVFLIVLVRVAKPDVTRADRLMLCFAVPTLVLVGATAFVTHGNANWAAVSVISVTILAAAVLVRYAAWRWLALSLAIGIVAQIVLPLGDANARRVSLPGLAKPDIYARTMGWRSLGEQVETLARRTGARTIAGDYRDIVASLLYYQRDRGRAVLSWPNSVVPEHQFDITHRLTMAAPGPVLLITRCASAESLAPYYRNVESIGPIEARTGPHSARSFFAFKLSEPIAEIGRRSGC
jgi:hypothetical protein